MPLFSKLEKEPLRVALAQHLAEELGGGGVHVLAGLVALVQEEGGVAGGGANVLIQHEDDVDLVVVELVRVQVQFLAGLPVEMLEDTNFTLST